MFILKIQTTMSTDNKINKRAIKFNNDYVTDLF